eukprot:Em0009g1172a
MQALGPPLSQALSLTVKSYSQLPFPLLQTVNDGCLLLYEPCKDISLFAITVTEHGLAAVVFRKQFPQGGEQRLEERSSDRLPGRSVGEDVDVCLKSKKQKYDKASKDYTATRRSARLAEKRIIKETSENRDTVGIASASCENKECGSIEASFQSESMQTVTSFIESLQTMDNYYSWTLPETVSACFAKEPTSIQGVTAVQARDPTNEDNGLLLAIAITNGGLYVCFLSMAERSVKYFTELLPVTENVQCLCFQNTTQWNLSDIHLCTGGQAGTVCVWHIWFQKEETERLKYTCATDVKHAQGSITACSFSHDGRSQVTCLSWSSDGRLLGVGGADDCAQVVSVDETVSRKPQSSCSLLKYFSPVHAAKLRHTHILKGHVSFVSGISFFSRHLVSVGLDGQILFWDVQQPDVFDKIEEVEPKCGFKLGPSNQCEALPASVTGIRSSEILLILRGQKSKTRVAVVRSLNPDWLTGMVISFGKHTSQLVRHDPPKITPTQRHDPPKITPTQRHDSPKITPTQRHDPPKITPTQRHDPPKITPTQRHDPPKITPTQRHDPPKITPTQRHDPPKITPTQRHDPPKITPNQRHDPPKITPTQRHDPPKITPTQRHDPPKITPTQRHDPPKIE